jgi:hypothetical protein
LRARLQQQVKELKVPVSRQLGEPSRSFACIYPPDPSNANVTASRGERQDAEAEAEAVEEEEEDQVQVFAVTKSTKPTKDIYFMAKDQFESVVTFALFI